MAAPKKAPRRKKGGGGGGGLGSGLVWGLVAVVAAGLLWVAWPAFFPPPPPPKRADTVKQAQRLSSEHPDAEAFNPDGGDLKKK